jgi:cytochrome c-type biogenesis protein CcmI
VSLWLALAAMTALAAALVAWPLLRPPRAPSARRDYELQVYREQLVELARARERGLLGEREAQAARLEVERRVAAVPGQPSTVAGRATPALMILALIARCWCSGCTGHRPADLPSALLAAAPGAPAGRAGAGRRIPSVED